jgi:hypothetical protein
MVLQAPRYSYFYEAKNWFVRAVAPRIIIIIIRIKIRNDAPRFLTIEHTHKVFTPHMREKRVYDGHEGCLIPWGRDDCGNIG